MATLETQGISLYYELHGERGAPPVVLITGLGGVGTSWGSHPGRFAKGHFVVVPDQRGTGRTTHAAAPKSPADREIALERIDMIMAHDALGRLGEDPPAHARRRRRHRLLHAPSPVRRDRERHPRRRARHAARGAPDPRRAGGALLRDGANVRGWSLSRACGSPLPCPETKRGSSAAFWEARWGTRSARPSSSCRVRRGLRARRRIHRRHADDPLHRRGARRGVAPPPRRPHRARRAPRARRLPALALDAGRRRAPGSSRSGARGAASRRARGASRPPRATCTRHDLPLGPGRGHAARRLRRQ